jgi:hypothetical protein
MRDTDVLDLATVPSEAWLATLVLALLLAGLAVLGRARLRAWWWDWRLRRALRRLGRPVLRDVRLPDGLGGLWRFDYALPQGEGVLLLTVRHYPGLIYAGETLDEWTQMLGGRRHPFPNPLRELERQRNSVGLLLGSLPPVEIILLFGPEARFPRDRPAAVFSLEDLQARAGDDPARGEGPAWQALLSLKA